MTICPFCKDSVSDLDAVQCPTCDAAHHEECWEANGETCSVYGCKSSIEEGLLGCPWCEEIYTVVRRFCMVCNQPLMNAREYRNFMERYDWVRLKLPEDQNILLTAGYLRNRGVVARINKGTQALQQGCWDFEQLRLSKFRWKKKSWLMTLSGSFPIILPSVMFAAMF